MTARLSRAAVGALVALSAAALLNAALYALAGDAVRIPGELTLIHVVVFTLTMAIPTAVVLAAWPRAFRVLVAVAVLVSLPFPFLEFERRTAIWLAAMHLVAGACAALLAPRFAASPERSLA